MAIILLLKSSWNYTKITTDITTAVSGAVQLQVTVVDKCTAQISLN